MLDTWPTWALNPPWWLIAGLALFIAAVGQRYLKKRLTAHLAHRGDITATHVVVTVAVLAAATVLIGFAFAMSYAALYEAATWLRHTPFGDLRWMFPIGIDAVIVYFLALDLVMEWQGRRHPLARYSAYLLSGLTVVLNISQTSHGGGWDEVLGHAGPPLVIILISEGVAAWIRHVAGMVHGELPERIPAGRMIAHPLSTLKVARLMLGWGITSYTSALKLEKARQYAVSMLKQQYGRAWRRRTPAHVRWMLANGHDLTRAFDLVDALTPSVPKTVAEVHQLRAHANTLLEGEETVSPPLSPEETEATPVSHHHVTKATPAAHSAPTEDPKSVEEDPLDALARFGIADIEDFLSHTSDTPNDGVAQLPEEPSTTGAADAPQHITEPTAPTSPHIDQESEDTSEDTQASHDESDTLIERARRALAANPKLTAQKLAEQLGCSRGHAWKLARAIRDATRDTNGDTTS